QPSGDGLARKRSQHHSSWPIPDPAHDTALPVCGSGCAGSTNTRCSVHVYYFFISNINNTSRIIYRFMLCSRASRCTSLSPHSKESCMQVPPWVKPGFWGGVIGALGIMIIGFGWLGWTLGSTAETLAQDRVNAALVAAFTPICVEK